MPCVQLTLQLFFCCALVCRGNGLLNSAPNHRQCVGARGKAGRACGPIGRLEPTIQDVLQASEEDEQLLRSELS